MRINEVSLSRSQVIKYGLEYLCVYINSTTNARVQNGVWNIEIILHVFPFDLKFILGVILIRNIKV